MQLLTQHIYHCILTFFFTTVRQHLPPHICYPIRLVFHQHLNSHVAYPGIPPEPSNHTRGQFLHLPSYPLLRLLWSKSDHKVTKKRILDQYHTSLHLAQPHCASITKHGHHVWQRCHTWCPCLVMLAQCGWAKWSEPSFCASMFLNDLIKKLFIKKFNQKIFSTSQMTVQENLKSVKVH